MDHNTIHCPIRYNDTHYYVCKEHEKHKNETPQSPRRFYCNLCKKKVVHGWTNPDHCSNPFGYLFLVPNICIECSGENKTCMWCGPYTNHDDV